MKDLSKKILENFQTRKKRSQKDSFIDFLLSQLSQKGIKAKVEENGSLIKSRNIVVGDISKANVVFTAHYDTAPRLPFPNFITPKNPLIYILYQIVLVLPVFLLCFLASLAAVHFFESLLIANIFCIIICFGLIYVIMFGKENNNTANDNTSGVITLCEIMLKMNSRQLDNAAFVFFDNEEIGLIGSAAFAKRHRKELEKKILINFDCVSDGDTVMFVVSGKRRKEYASQISAAYGSTEGYEVNPYITKALTTFYPSDQMNFPVNIGVAALKKSKIMGYYLDRIHTKHDTVFREENVHYLADGSIRFSDSLSHGSES